MPSSLVRLWVTYAESNCGPGATKVLTDCHASTTTYCTAVQYLDTNRIYPTGSAPITQSAQESWWLHQPGYNDAAHRLTASSSWGTATFANQANASVDSWFHDYVAGNFDSYNALMMDDTASSLADQVYETGYNSSQEITTNAGLQAAHDQMARAVTHANGSAFLQVNNGINVNPWLPTPFPLLDNPASVNGLVAEGVPESNGTLVGFYPTLLDDMSYVDHTPNDFIVLLSYDSSGSVQARRVQAATVLLGYSSGHTVSWAALEQGSANLAVWPEQGIVPTAAVQSMAAPSGDHCLDGSGVVCASGGHNDLQVAPGVYRREFRACYDQGAAFGRCAVIMNTTGSAITVQASWLTQSYSSQITLRGGDVQSGGTLDLSGSPFTAGSTTIAPHDAVLLSAGS